MKYGMFRLVMVGVLCAAVSTRVGAAQSALANGMGMGAGMGMGMMGASAGMGVGTALASEAIRNPLDTFFTFRLFRWLGSDRGEKASYIVGKLGQLEKDMDTKGERFNRRKAELLQLMRTFIPWMKKIDTAITALETQHSIQPITVEDNF